MVSFINVISFCHSHSKLTFYSFAYLIGQPGGKKVEIESFWVKHTEFSMFGCRKTTEFINYLWMNFTMSVVFESVVVEKALKITLTHHYREVNESK
jgi:hypothetical protein